MPVIVTPGPSSIAVTVLPFAGGAPGPPGPTGGVNSVDGLTGAVTLGSIYLAKTILTTDGDLLSRTAGVPDRITRATLAADTAFSTTFLKRTEALVIPAGVFNGTVDNTSAIAACHAANPGRTIGLPGPARITSALVITGGQGAGICRSDGTQALIYCDVGTGVTAITVNGTTEGAWNLTLLAGALGEATPRSVVRNGIHFNLSGRIGQATYIRCVGFNGFGVKIQSVWDSVVQEVVTIECGNVNQYALSVIDDPTNGASNHTVFNRLQAELSYDKAVKVDTLTYNCSFANIHSERLQRTTSVTADVSHQLLGVCCNYTNLRIEQAAAGAVPQVVLGSLWGSYSNCRVLNGQVQVILQIASALCTFTEFTINDPLTIAAVNVGRVVFNSCYLNAVNLTDQAEYGVTMADCRHLGNVTLYNSNCWVQIVRGYFVTGFTILDGSGNPSCQATGTSFDLVPTARLNRFSACTFRNALASFTAFGSAFFLWGCLVVNDATVGSNGTVVRAWDTQFGGDLNYTGGTAVGRGNGCYLSKTVLQNTAAQWTMTNAMT